MKLFLNIDQPHVWHKNVHFIYLAIFTTLLLSSCKQLLEKPQNSNLALITTVKDCQGILNNLQFNIQYPMDGELSCDDYYLTDDDYDGMGQVERQLYTWEPGAQRLVSAGASNDWYYVYSKVKDVNVVLEGLASIAKKNSGVSSEVEYKQAKGMALFIRSNCFFQIAQQYAKAYDASTANEDLGIPIRLTSDISNLTSRNTVQQTYDKIIADLTESTGLLPESVAVPTLPSKAAAYALLARVYLSMRKYSEAGAAANSSLQLKSDLLDYNDLDASSEAPFTRFNKEVIYFSSMDYLDSRQRIHPSIISSFTDANDLRKSLFFTENPSPDEGTFYFKGSYSAEDYTYYNGLTTDEMYLIRAECYARAGDAPSAMADLNALLLTRWVTNTYSNMTATDANDALVKILLERRKELVMRGARWGDLKRLNKIPAEAQTLTRIVQGVTYTLTPNDTRYQLLIPQAVVQYNSSIIQNPR